MIAVGGTMAWAFFVATPALKGRWAIFLFFYQQTIQTWLVEALGMAAASFRTAGKRDFSSFVCNNSGRPLQAMVYVLTTAIFMKDPTTVTGRFAETTLLKMMNKLHQRLVLLKALCTILNAMIWSLLHH